MSDFDEWKKKRDAERARRERENAGDNRSYVTPASLRPSDPSSEKPIEPPRTLDGGKRTYQGTVPDKNAPPAPKKAKQNGALNGCLGCLGLVVGFVVLAGLAGWFAFSFYWRQIEQRGAVNVLVLGIDERPQEDPPFRSDTMILTGFNPVRREVAVMSIPRDLWITLPDGSSNRINTAHFFGGATLAKETVSDNFGVPLPYYVKLNFGGFTSIIDAMGGVPINVPEALHDENYPTADYGVMTIDIPAGEQVMDGETALIYARSRYSTSDFDRGRRQQEIIAAIQAQLLKPETWGKYPAIFAAAQSAITTDIPQTEWPALTTILLRSEIHRVAIERNDTQDFITDGGAQVLLPVWESINPKLARYFE
jgi:LCP family protein required for cell wall assembly